jgi:uncharacterized protein YndB with AHSA1/START domain
VTRSGDESGRNRTTVQKKSDREVVVTRTFDCPARLVFEAWSRAELFRQWWVPKSLGMTLRSCELDVRTGGTYRLVFGDDPANTMAFYGRYLEVVPNSRIVWTNEEGGADGSITTVTLEERDGRTQLVMSELYPTREAFDAAGTGAQDALDETFGQLDEVLAGIGSHL